MSNEENKTIDLKQFKRRRTMAEYVQYNKATEQLGETMWEELRALWARYADEAPKVPITPDGLRMSGDADAVFSVLLKDLILLTQIKGADSEDIIAILCLSAFVHCPPEGRLYELLGRASGLLMYGDEEATAKQEPMDMEDYMRRTMPINIRGDRLGQLLGKQITLEDLTRREREAAEGFLQMTADRKSEGEDDVELND
jgi:hypothetical protein